MQLENRFLQKDMPFNLTIFSGFDRMEEGMGELRIPAPKVENAEDFCRVKLYWYQSLNDWSKDWA